tara:strand:- start:700 stop:1365 length:666 start_codon:yes stop_codon:yes gene_type:complete
MRKHEDRILFLKQFAKELILQSKKPEHEIEKQKLEDTHKGEFIPTKLITPALSQKPQHIPLVPQQIRQPKIRRFSPQRYKIRLARPITPRRPMVKSIHPEIKTKPQSLQIHPEPSSTTINLGKLNIFTKDPRVTIIECPGPGKNILAKTAGQVTVTKLSLTKDEIQQIINIFSEKSKIPVISGLFKAAVGNLILTAVISDLVGTRFIITKMSSRLRIEKSH